jgi:hypothetical protein
MPETAPAEPRKAQARMAQARMAEMRAVRWGIPAISPTSPGKRC